MSSRLFSPLALGDVELPNRVVVAPMCQYSANDGSASGWHLQHLAQLAYSGAGLVVVEATAVERRGRITHGCLGLYSDDNEAALARTIAAARRVGGSTSFGIQLAHAGRKASSRRPWEGGAPSPPAKIHGRPSHQARCRLGRAGTRRTPCRSMRSKQRSQLS